MRFMLRGLVTPTWERRSPGGGCVRCREYVPIKETHLVKWSRIYHTTDQRHPTSVCLLKIFKYTENYLNDWIKKFHLINHKKETFSYNIQINVTCMEVFMNSFLLNEEMLTANKI